MFFKRKCGCGSKDTIVYTDTFATMGGDVTLCYCQSCFNKKKASDDAQRAEWGRAEEIRRADLEKQRYYENLKREVELHELTEKAKLFGINVKENGVK